MAVPHIIVDGSHVFEMLIVRCRSGISFPESETEVHTIFMLIGSKDERNFHLRALSAIAQIVQDKNFEKNWMSARDEQVLKDLILLANRKR